MNMRWKEWVIIISGLTATLMLLNTALSGQWTILLHAVWVVGLISLIVWGKYPAYLAFGILAPFGATLFGVIQIPTIALALTVCIASVGMRASIKAEGQPYLGRLDPLIIVYTSYLIIRYLSDPVLPGYALGLSNDVTGFRSWLNHLIGLALFFSLGFMIVTGRDLRAFFRWLVVFSIVFAVVFMGIMSVPGQALTSMLSKVGIFTASFDNGWRRFVFLPIMGTFLITAAMLPALFNSTPFKRHFYMGLGILAVIAGGGRGAVLTLLIIVGVILLLQRRRWLLGLLVAIIVGLSITADTMAEYWGNKTVTPIIRVMGSFSPALSTEIGAMATMEWRYVRWKRAIEDIKQHPWFGMGYGGVKGYFSALSDIQDPSAELSVELDVATGGTHNGYLSAARNLGIPITVLFVIIGIKRVFVHWHRIRQLKRNTILAEAHIYVCAYIIMMLIGMGIGGDITLASNWMFLALSFIVERLDVKSQGNITRDE